MEISVLLFFGLVILALPTLFNRLILVRAPVRTHRIDQTSKKAGPKR